MHWEAVPKILTYLNGTISFGICPGEKLNGFKLKHLIGKKLNSMNDQILRRRLRRRHAETTCRDHLVQQKADVHHPINH
jgi:hypothetical protein